MDAGAFCCRLADPGCHIGSEKESERRLKSAIPEVRRRGKAMVLDKDRKRRGKSERGDTLCSRRNGDPPVHPFT